MPVKLKVLGSAALLQFVQIIVMAIPANVQLGVGFIAAAVMLIAALA